MTQSQPLRLIVIDDHPLFRAGVVAALKNEPGLDLCGEAQGSIDGRALATKLRPDAAVVDLMLGNDDGLKLVRELRQEFPAMHIVVLSMLDAGVYAPKALQAGANVFVSKIEGPQAIIAALRRDRLLLRPARPKSASELATLTERELQVFIQLGQGHSTQEIASALGVSVKTIESHREGIKAKLNLPHANALIARAALWARDQGLVR